MRSIFSILALVTLASAQTQTILDPDGSGNSIIEFITVDPAVGIPSTVILQTLTAVTTAAPIATTAATTAAATTPDDQQQGPVGAPAPTATGPLPTTYEYTTTDVNGVTTVIHDTFTPSFAPTQAPPVQTFSATILGFSQWLSMVGTNTVAASTNGAERWSVPNRVWGMGVGFLAGALGGAWLVIT